MTQEKNHARAPPAAQPRTYYWFIHAMTPLTKIPLHVQDDILLPLRVQLHQAASGACAGCLGVSMILGTLHEPEPLETVILPVLEATSAALPINWNRRKVSEVFTLVLRAFKRDAQMSYLQPNHIEYPTTSCHGMVEAQGGHCLN